ncbi:NRDE family protein [Franzmannia qiaohouensis]|uniref:NRDE family protein n=1 Tax=Franzmannia qiaohouensis TaxID=1329370 RepID=A0ABU1HA21_9GAMM|nr:NRDE family protein [Halomonas qiaohouensis]MDR5904307.1 NRDE family protein [Halomonas qiaohouensis]
MCLIAFAFCPDDPVPLRLIANRDERYARPTAPLARWGDTPAILGGRDLVAGGSWLALHQGGRMAAVTNVRDPRISVADNTPSRGELVRQALLSDDLSGWLARLAEGDAWQYGGFNLLAGDAQQLWHLHRGYGRLMLQSLSPGHYGLSNADLETPWPKLQLAKAGLTASLNGGRWPADALAAMAEHHPISDPARLPDTGVGEALERFLSPPFIIGEAYGTRATSWLSWHADGHIDITERRFGPGGTPAGETSECLLLDI